MTYDLVSLSLCTSCPSSLGGLYVLLSAWILHGFNLKSILWIVWIHRKKTVSLPPSAAWHVLRPHELLLLQPVRLHLWSFHPKRMDSYLEYTKSKYFSLFWIGGFISASPLASLREFERYHNFIEKEVARVSSLGVSNLFPIDWSCDTCELPRFPVNFEPCLATLFFGGLSEANEHVGISIVHVYIYIYPRIRKHVVYYVVYKLLFPGRPTWKSH